jgi:hypothetical protein
MNRLAVLAVSCVLALAFACNAQDEDKDIPPEDASADGGQDDDTTGDDACPDEDKDGWCAPQDCNDHNPFMSPVRAEDCADGYDNDCNGFTDTDDPACMSPQDDDTGAG